LSRRPQPPRGQWPHTRDRRGASKACSTPWAVNQHQSPRASSDNASRQRVRVVVLDDEIRRRLSRQLVHTTPACWCPQSTDGKSGNEDRVVTFVTPTPLRGLLRGVWPAARLSRVRVIHLNQVPRTSVANAACRTRAAVEGCLRRRAGRRAAPVGMQTVIPLRPCRFCGSREAYAE